MLAEGHKVVEVGDDFVDDLPCSDRQSSWGKYDGKQMTQEPEYFVFPVLYNSQ